jgi:Tol biopolymer transport system component
MGRFGGSRRPAARGFVWAAAVAGLIAACSSSSSGPPPQNADVVKAVSSLGAGDWNGALASCLAAKTTDPSDCDAQYCEFIARSMLVVDEVNTFLLPRYRRPLTPMPGDIESLATTNMLLDSAIQSGEAVTTHQCEFDLPTLPLKIGDVDAPIVDGEVRGRWTTRDAHIMTALFDSISYGLQAEFNPQPVPPPPAGDIVPALPPLLDSMRQHLLSQDSLLLSEPADPANGRGGWLDRNGNGKPDSADELLIDIFKPGTQDRLFDFSTAEFVRGEELPKGVLTPTASLPPAQCGYTKFHIDDVATGSSVTTTDGMSFSPDGTKIAIPLIVNGSTQINTANTDGSSPTCITCPQDATMPKMNGNNDGVRWRPGTGDTMIFVSDRDHPHATGNDGAGFGQELYAMHADGTQQTRLTTSDDWATNYHVNWSPDGQHIVWGRTQARTWDVMVADFVVDPDGTMHLANSRALVHDTTWWETHGYTADNKYVITTNTRMGFQSTDLYAVDVSNGQNRIRLTDNLAWDEHGHLSPDGREIAWISGRWNPASVLRLNDGSISPTYDFLWIVPGIFFEFLHAPAGYTSELTLMDTDGSNVHALTNDQQVVADSQWSFDGTRIIFRETSGDGQSTRIRVLTFDDCMSPGTPGAVTL